MGRSRQGRLLIFCVCCPTIQAAGLGPGQRLELLSYLDPVIVKHWRSQAQEQPSPILPILAAQLTQLYARREQRTRPTRDEDPLPQQRIGSD